jgi:hypothetical protein
MKYSMEIDELHEGVTDELSKAQKALSNDQSVEGERGEVLGPTARRPGATAAERRRATALRMGSLAAAAHHAAGDLEEQFPQAASYFHDAAVGFEHISGLLRDPHLDEAAKLVGDLGRKQPAAVVAGVVLIGLGLSWYLKASGDGLNDAGP